ncbi:hypothetical protein CL648_04260 [bacterium]|nr:hypothetical protein [bacterium]
MASNLNLIRQRVVRPVFLVILGTSLLGLALGHGVWAGSLAAGGCFGALGFWLFVRAQDQVMSERHYGRFFAYFLARLAIYAIPIGYAAAKPWLSMALMLVGLFSYNGYLIAVLIIKARRGLMS